jgi:hypothetical protein
MAKVLGKRDRSVHLVVCFSNAHAMFCALLQIDLAVKASQGLAQSWAARQEAAPHLDPHRSWDIPLLDASAPVGKQRVLVSVWSKETNDVLGTLQLLALTEPCVEYNRSLLSKWRSSQQLLQQRLFLLLELFVHSYPANTLTDKFLFPAIATLTLGIHFALPCGCLPPQRSGKDGSRFAAKPKKGHGKQPESPPLAACLLRGAVGMGPDLGLHPRKGMASNPKNPSGGHDKQPKSHVPVDDVEGIVHPEAEGDRRRLALLEGALRLIARRLSLELDWAERKDFPPTVPNVMKRKRWRDMKGLTPLHAVALAQALSQVDRFGLVEVHSVAFPWVPASAKVQGDADHAADTAFTPTELDARGPAPSVEPASSSAAHDADAQVTHTADGADKVPLAVEACGQATATGDGDFTVLVESHSQAERSNNLPAGQSKCGHAKTQVPTRSMSTAADRKGVEVVSRGKQNKARAAEESAKVAGKNKARASEESAKVAEKNKPRAAEESAKVAGERQGTDDGDRDVAAHLESNSEAARTGGHFMHAMATSSKTNGGDARPLSEPFQGQGKAEVQGAFRARTGGRSRLAQGSHNAAKARTRLAQCSKRKPGAATFEDGSDRSCADGLVQLVLQRLVDSGMRQFKATGAPCEAEVARYLVLADAETCSPLTGKEIEALWHSLLRCEEYRGQAMQWEFRWLGQLRRVCHNAGCSTGGLHDVLVNRIHHSRAASGRGGYTMH